MDKYTYIYTETRYNEVEKYKKETENWKNECKKYYEMYQTQLDEKARTTKYYSEKLHKLRIEFNNYKKEFIKIEKL